MSDSEDEESDGDIVMAAAALLDDLQMDLSRAGKIAATEILATALEMLAARDNDAFLRALREHFRERHWQMELLPLIQPP